MTNNATKKRVFIDEISKEELNKEIEKGYEDIINGRIYTEEEAKQLINNLTNENK